MTTEKTALSDAIRTLGNLRALRGELRRVTGDTALVVDMNDALERMGRALSGLASSMEVKHINPDGSIDWDAEVTP